MTATPAASLAALNAGDAAGFIAVLGDLFEHSPWVAEQAAAQRPFASARALHDAMMGCVLAAPLERQIALIQAHPELAGQEASAGTLTADSSSEQSRLGINRLSPEAHGRLAELNAAYRARFGFPCLIALRLHADAASVFASFAQRLGHARDIEIAIALEQIGAITRGRLAARLGLSAGSLTLHTLDTAAGRPAAGLRYTLAVSRDAAWQEILTAQTNADGRSPAPLLVDLDMEQAVYRLDFHVGDYHRRSTPGEGPADGAGEGAAESVVFLDIVPIVFGIADPGTHYHVPLLLTPWSYSTYRGS